MSLKKRQCVYEQPKKKRRKISAAKCNKQESEYNRNRNLVVSRHCFQDHFDRVGTYQPPPLPFHDSLDNQQFLQILNSLQSFQWYKGYSFMLPLDILQIIAVMSTGRIIQCNLCDKQTEILWMHDKTYFSNNKKPIISFALDAMIGGPTHIQGLVKKDQ